MKTLLESIELNDGYKMPMIAFGPGIAGYSPKYKIGKKNIIERVWNKLVSRPLLLKQYTDAITNAIEMGYSSIDHSGAYHSEKEVGEAIRRSGIQREQLFFTTRVSNGIQLKGESAIREQFMRTLDRVGLDYVDLYQFHWPVTDYYLKTWEVMLKIREEGLCRSVGVANCHQHHLENIINSCGVVPAVDQVEVNPLFTNKELINYCNHKRIIVEAYSPIARFDDRLVRLPLLKRIGDKYNKSIVQIILRWHIQNGLIPVTKSLNKVRQAQNIDLFDFQLTDEEMKAIDSININARVRYDPDNCDFSIL